MVIAPAPETLLDVATARSVPADTGVYAAWITDPNGLEQCGVAGPEPRVVYIGKASGRGGLRSRLLRHARDPFYSLADLLASRGTILPCWWHFAWKDQPFARTVKAPPLARLSSDAALAWQHQHLRWGWVTLEDPRAVESALIATHQPLLNLHGRGLVKLGPPQLRDIGDYEAARAAWLFSTVWIAAITAAEDEWNTWNEAIRVIGFEIDEEGWPMPLGSGGRPVKFRCPTETGARRIIRRTREVTFNAYDVVLRPKKQTVDQALELAFRREVDAIDTPSTLPSADRMIELRALIRLLPDVVH
jgi:hypothetical protein